MTRAKKIAHVACGALVASKYIGGVAHLGEIVYYENVLPHAFAVVVITFAVVVTIAQFFGKGE